MSDAPHHSSPDRERRPRRVRPRPQDAGSSARRSIESGAAAFSSSPTSSPGPPLVPPVPPRHGIAFILNDPQASGLTGEATTVEDSTWPSRLGQLPQRRSSTRPAAAAPSNAFSRERWQAHSFVPTASPVWADEASTTRDTAWHVVHRRADATGDEGEGDEDHEAIPDPFTRAREHDDDDDQEEKAEAQPAPRATVAPNTAAASASPAPALSREEKRRGRTCRIDGCSNYIVHKGLCCRHGGARKCSTDSCDSTAKYMGLCWKHGGSTWCKVDGCTKRAKAKGRCWAHGGGTPCSHDACTKVAVSNGLCWAHGGGKRCLFDGCNRPGYERTNGFCDRHFDELQDVDYYEV